MRIAFFEDEQAAQFGSIALLRPVFELLCGHFSVRDRALRHLPVRAWGALCRDFLEASYSEEHPEAHINDRAWLARESTLLINGRWLCAPSDFSKCDPDTVGVINGEIAWVTLDPLEMPVLFSQDLSTALTQIARDRRRVKAPGRLVNHPWDLVSHNSQQISLDHRDRSIPTKSREISNVSVVGNSSEVFIDPTAEIDPFVVIDVRNGPVFVDSKAKIQAFTRIEGPCYIGRESQLFRTNLREGSSIGPVCRVGGEVEASILQGYVNKYHDGFLGHSFVSPWCNLGALTTNSDLKNDYSSVSVPLSGDSIPTGQMKVGCFLGDHSKTAIGSVFNTGSAVGVMCQILPAGELLPKHIPSFTRFWHGEIAECLSLENSLATARAAMNRRGVELTDAQEKLLRHVYLETRGERQKAFNRQSTVLPRAATSTGITL